MKYCRIVVTKNAITRNTGFAQNELFGPSTVSKSNTIPLNAMTQKAWQLKLFIRQTCVNFDGLFLLWTDFLYFLSQLYYQTSELHSLMIIWFRDND